MEEHGHHSEIQAPEFDVAACMESVISNHCTREERPCDNPLGSPLNVLQKLHIVLRDSSRVHLDMLWFLPCCCASTRGLRCANQP